MSSEESLSYSHLGVQATKATEDYLSAAIDAVERKFGAGAAAEFPQIVAAMVQASATEYLAAMISHRVAPNLSHIASAIYRNE